jgi:hypothetical protein
MHVVQEEGHY